MKLATRPLVQLVALLGLTLGVGQTFAAAPQGPTVSTAWLAQNMADVQVVEVRSDFASFGKKADVQLDKKTGKNTVNEVGGHIVGARLVDFKVVRTERKLGDKNVKFLAPEKEDFQARMRAAGVTNDKPIVLVPMGQSIADIDESLRLYWTFKLYGEDRIAVLDGGETAWLAEGRPVSSDAVADAKGDWVAKAERPELIAGSDDVVSAMDKQNVQLVDARPMAQFYGIVKSPAVLAPGHIDHAKVFSPELLTRGADGALYFLNAKAYQGVLKASGIDPNAPSIAYCNTGHLASGAWFAMHEIAGITSTRLYDGSLSRWTAEQRPLINAAAQ